MMIIFDKEKLYKNFDERDDIKISIDLQKQDFESTFCEFEFTTSESEIVGGCGDVEG